jgi:hypothetical protein
MKWKLVVVFLVGLVVGLAIPYLMPGNPVQAEQNKGVKWEYRAEVFYGDEGRRQVVSKRLNELAAEGWEYVGLISTPAERNDVLQGMVMFKRPNK